MFVQGKNINFALKLIINILTDISVGIMPNEGLIICIHKTLTCKDM